MGISVQRGLTSHIFRVNSPFVGDVTFCSHKGLRYVTVMHK